MLWVIWVRVELVHRPNSNIVSACSLLIGPPFTQHCQDHVLDLNRASLTSIPFALIVCVYVASIHCNESTQYVSLATLLIALATSSRAFFHETSRSVERSTVPLQQQA
jgi:hypothetical protein